MEKELVPKSVNFPKCSPNAQQLNKYMFIYFKQETIWSSAYNQNTATIRLYLDSLTIKLLISMIVFPTGINSKRENTAPRCVFL